MVAEIAYRKKTAASERKKRNTRSKRRKRPVDLSKANWYEMAAEKIAVNKKR